MSCMASLFVKLDMTQMLIKVGMDKYTKSHPCNGILFSH